MRSAVLHSILLLSFVLITSCSRHSPAPVKEVKPRKYNRIHQKRMTNRYVPQEVTVKKGDTLYALGFKYSIDYKKLARINHIKSPYKIYPGQKLQLKKAKSRRRKHLAQARSHPVRIKPQPKATVVKKTTPTQKAKHNSNKKPVRVTKKTTVAKPVSKPPRKPAVKPQPKPVVKKPVVKKTTTTAVKPASSQWMWPIKGPVISTFSATDVSRKGIDIGASQGSTVVSTNNGVVVYSGDGLRGYGELIIIKHTDNLLSAYAHNSQRLVKEGQSVKQGQQIAKSGKGNDGKSLLHFEIRKNGQPVNPLKYLPKR